MAEANTSDTPAVDPTEQLYVPVEGELQLTVRAVAIGCLLGGVVCAMNIYFGLRTGWSIGGSLIAAILSFSLFRSLQAAMPNMRPFTALETNIAQTAGSAAGSMTSAAGLLAAIPAMGMLGYQLSYFELTLWSASVAWLGVFYAVPLRRQMVLVEKLRFPTGTATAQTIVAMYSEGADAQRKSNYLVGFGVLAATFTLATFVTNDVLGIVALDHPPLETWIPIGFLTVAAGYGFSLLVSPLMYGAGILIGPRVAISLLLGALLSWGVLAPWVETTGWVEPGKTMSYAEGARGWILWPGVAIMVADALTSLAMSWRTILNTFRSTGDGDAAADTSSDEIPNAWWIGGLAVAGTFTVASSSYLFGIHPLMTVLAIVMSSVLAAIAVRSTGETDINPIGGMGKVTQLVYGAIAPGSIPTNLMSAAVTGSGASQAGDMMHDLKTGYLLGASPRRQMVAQLIGIGAGIVVCVPIYVLFDTVYDIGGEELPAPAAHAWRAMAEVLSEGLDAMPEGALGAVVVGLIFGTVLPVVRSMLPEAQKNYLPSALAMGIAFIVPAYYAVSMFIGALIYQVWMRVDGHSAKALGFSVASGLIAGEGLMGVVTAVLKLLGIG
jgi:putative OPT family oligopeptide transporter